MSYQHFPQPIDSPLIRRIMFYVYIHLRLDTGEIFYVGKGQRKRAWSRKSRNGWWHNVVAKAGYSATVLETFSTEVEALRKENQLILEYLSSGITLVNLTSGGEAAKLSRESKEKISRAKLGKPKAMEERERMSTYRLGRCPGGCTRDKMSRTRLGRPQPRRVFNRKLSRAEISSIFRDTRPSWKIQEDYEVSQGTVSRIRTGKKT